MSTRVVPTADIKKLWDEGFGDKNPKQGAPAIVIARDLSIVWSLDNRYWNWIPCPHSGHNIAELKDVCWLQIDGKYDTTNLIEGQTYAVDFVVMLKDNLTIDGPVTLKLTRPTGYSLQKKVDLKAIAKNEWIGLRAGYFSVRSRYAVDKFVKFSLRGDDGTSWKTGLTVIGAVISPYCTK